MIFVYLALAIILAIYLFLLLLTKNYPNYFPKNVLLNKSSFLFIIFSSFLSYTTLASLFFGLSDYRIQNGVKCYQPTNSGLYYPREYNACSEVFSYFSQAEFIGISLVSLVLLIFLVRFFLKKHKDFADIVSEDFNLFEDKKDLKVRKGFLIIVISAAIIVMIFVCKALFGNEY